MSIDCKTIINAIHLLLTYNIKKLLTTIFVIKIIMTNQYIHISEAVKKYEKTRQTFYNYLHKGLVRSKKINNRTYLHINDIEELLSDYIVNTTTNELSEVVVEEIYDDLTTQKEYIDTMNSSFDTYQKTVEEKFNFQNEKIKQSITNNHSIINTLQYSLEHLLTRFQHTQQKSRFIGIISIIIIVHLCIVITLL